MPIEFSQQLRKEGEFYFKKEKPRRVKYPTKINNKLRISSNQLLTNALLGTALMANFINSIDADENPAKKLSANIPLTTPFNKHKYPIKASLSHSQSNPNNNPIPYDLVYDYPEKYKNKIFLAIKNSNLRAVKALIIARANVNEINSYGNTPLHLACEIGNLEMVEALIKAGVDVNFKNKGLTPLHKAYEKNHLKIVKALIKAGADVNTKEFFQDIELVELTRDFALLSPENKIKFKIIKSLIIAENKKSEEAKKFVEDQAKKEAKKLSEAQEIAEAVEQNNFDQSIKLTPKSESCKLIETKQQDSSNSELIFSLAVGLAITATSWRFLGFSTKSTNSPAEIELINKSSEILNPINDYLNKLHFFTLDKIDMIEMGMINGKLFFELENQPQE